jgi:hypothetical protein
LSFAFVCLSMGAETLVFISEIFEWEILLKVL